MTRIRILHFIDTLGAGGAERQLTYLLENLDRSRYDCHVLTTYDRFRHYEVPLRQLQIPLYSLHHGNLTASHRAGALARYIQLLWSLRPKIVHSWLHYPNLIARAARPVCPPHRLVSAMRTEYAPRQQRSEWLTGWLSDFRIVNSNNKPKNLPLTTTIFIPNGVPLPQPSPYTATSRSTFDLLMVARIDPRKDHLTLLNALHQLIGKLPSGFQTHLIGETTDPETQRQIENTIKDLNLSSFVHLHPPTNDIAYYYAHADITTLPSISEGFANVILESFAAAKPIIISEAANKAGLVQHGINGWIFPTRNSHALADQIDAALNTPEPQRLRMGLNGRTVAEQFTILRMVDQYQQLYERALKRA